MQIDAAVCKFAAQEQFGKVFADSGHKHLQKIRNIAPCLYLDLMDHYVKPDASDCWKCHALVHMSCKLRVARQFNRSIAIFGSA